MESSAFREQYNAVVKLNSSEGPSRNIFEPKFEARRQVCALIKQIVTAIGGGTEEAPLEAQAQMARCIMLLGNIMIETDEERDGFLRLLEAHRLMLLTVAGSRLRFDWPTVPEEPNVSQANAPSWTVTPLEKEALKLLSDAKLVAADGPEATLRDILVADTHPLSATPPSTSAAAGGEEVPAEGGRGASASLPRRDAAFAKHGGMEFAFEYLESLNALCVFLANDQETRFRLDDARKLLHRAEAAFHDWNTWFSATHVGAALGELLISDDGSLVDKTDAADSSNYELKMTRLSVEGCYTTVVFLLSQVYGQKGDGLHAAKYCHITMARQLKTRQEFSRREWAKNAIMLSVFYDSMRDFGKAIYCLHAGEKVMPTEPASEETRGVVCWGFGRHYLNQLEHYANVLQGQEALVDQGLSRADEWWVDFDILSTPPQATKHVSNFDEARDIFREGQRWLQEAMTYYVMDGSCTDHIKLQQDLANLYKALIPFEGDVERRVAMHGRRIQFFEKVVTELNPQAYLTLIRQLLFDCGDVTTDVVELRLAQRKAEGQSMGKPLSDKKFNEVCHKALDFFEKFCDTFKDRKTQTIPDVIDEDNRVAFFRCLMRMAHVQSRCAAKSPQEEYENLSATIRAYERAVTFASKNKLDASGSEVLNEYQLAKEMVTLLPSKQRDLRAAYGRSTW